MKKYLGMIIVLVVFFSNPFIASAVRVENDTAAIEFPTVGVLPFSNDVEGVQVGAFMIDGKDTASDYLIEYLLDYGKMEVVEQAGLIRIFDEQGLSLSGLIEEKSKIAAAAKLIPAEYLIVGRITSINTKGSNTAYINKGNGAGGRTFIVAAELQAKIIEVKTGLVLLTFTGSGESRNAGYMVNTAGGAYFNFGGREIAQESISNAIQKAAKMLARKISEAV